MFRSSFPVARPARTAAFTTMATLAAEQAMSFI